MVYALEGKNDAFGIVGYQDPCSIGGELLKHIREETGEIVLGEYRYPINCEIAKFSLSAHDDGDELDRTAALARERVVWIHGERRRIKAYLKGKDSSMTLGKNGKEVEL